MTVWVIIWEWPDHSGFGVVGVLANEAQAQAMTDALNQHCMVKNFVVAPYLVQDYSGD